MNSKILTLACLILTAQSSRPSSIGTAINYQGRLTEMGQPANGQYEIRFQIFGAANGGNPLGTDTRAPVPVADGLFTTQIDFGSGVFNGTAYWLEVAARSNGSQSPYTILTRGSRSTPCPTRSMR